MKITPSIKLFLGLNDIQGTVKQQGDNIIIDNLPPLYSAKDIAEQVTGLKFTYLYPSTCKLREFTHEELNEIERTKVIENDFRNESNNVRVLIYELIRFKMYIQIFKKDGNYIKYSVAQNPLTLLLKQANNEIV